MRSLSRRRLTLTALGAIAILIGCSRLTEVDWTLVPVGSPGGTTGASDAGGAGAGDDSGGAPSAGQTSEGGEGGETEGGAPHAGAAGSMSGSGGSGGMSGGVAGSAGSGGASGSGGNGGAGGTAGSGGKGGAGGSGGSGPAPCTGTPSTVVASDIVLFDGGPGKVNSAWGGRVGLDAACEAARVALNLTQTKTHAFITVTSDDSIARFDQVFSDLLPNSRIVSKTGIRLANSFSDLIDATIEQSMVCAGVVGAEVKTWLSGSKYACAVEGTLEICGQFDSINDTCDGWTRNDYHSEIQARYGKTTTTDKSFFSAAVPELSFLKVSCDTADDNVLCLAYTP